MARSMALQAALDDVLQAVRIESFDGGLNSEADPSDLQLNESPNAQNMKLSKNGELAQRAGYFAFCLGLGAIDGVKTFLDANNAVVLAVWSGGNLYNCISGTAVLIAGGVLTGGQRVGYTVYQNYLIYSEGITPMRRWNPATAVEEAVPNSGGIGVIAPPAAKVFASYQGQVMAARCVAAAVTEVDGLRWSDVSDMTVWRATNIFKVGQGAGGEINSLQLFGIADTGITPFKALFVGKSAQGCFAMKGATSAFEEVVLNVPVGVFDGASVKYIPGPDGAGYMVFLGTDLRVWYSNGAQSGELSGKIRSELSQYIRDRLAISSSSIFCAALNATDSQYILDCSGNRQYVYDWNTKAWMRYTGWISGYWTDGVDNSGAPRMFCASSGIYWMNNGLDDAGATILAWWDTPRIHGGDPTVLKSFKYAIAEYETDVGNCVLTFTTNDGQGNSLSRTIAPPGTSGSGSARWDIAIWDTDVWGGGGTLTLTPYKKKIRLGYTSTRTGLKNALRGYNCTVRIACTTPGALFNVLSLVLLYLPRGRKQVGLL